MDTLTGGADDDTHVWTAAAQSGTGSGNRDIISDFAQGDDVIDLSAFAGATWLGTGAFTGAVNEVRYTQPGGGITVVQVDTDGNAAADFEIELTGVITLDETDFVGVTVPGTDDTLSGGVGNQTLDGGGGDDVIYGNVSETSYNAAGIAGLKLWLDANDLDGDGTAEGAGEAGLNGGNVQTWQDKSAGNNGRHPGHRHQPPALPGVRHERPLHAWISTATIISSPPPPWTSPARTIIEDLRRA